MVSYLPPFVLGPRSCCRRQLLPVVIDPPAPFPFSCPFLSPFSSAINLHGDPSTCSPPISHAVPLSSTYRKIASFNPCPVSQLISPASRLSLFGTNPNSTHPEAGFKLQTLRTFGTDRLSSKNKRGAFEAMSETAAHRVAPAQSKVDQTVEEGVLNLLVTSDRPSIVGLSPSQLDVEPSPEAVSVKESVEEVAPAGPTPPPLLILDLNGCILYREYTAGTKVIKPRPYLDDLFQYVFASHSKDKQTPNWEIMVWSSAQPRNVELMLQAMEISKRPQEVPASRRVRTAPKDHLGDISNRLDSLSINKPAPASDAPAKTPIKRTVIDVWNRDALDLSSEDYDRKVATTKDLRKVWNQFTWTDPRTGEHLKWGAHNTVIVDDSPDKLSLQPDSLCLVEEFKGDAKDTGILKLIETLKSIRDATHIADALKNLKAKETASPTTS